MAMHDVIAQIDAEITKLEQAKTLLSGGPALASIAVKGRRGRPKGSTSAKKAVVKKVVAKTRKPLSPEARKNIADAQKKRWAAAKKAS